MDAESLTYALIGGGHSIIGYIWDNGDRIISIKFYPNCDRPRVHVDGIAGIAMTSLAQNGTIKFKRRICHKYEETAPDEIMRIVALL